MIVILREPDPELMKLMEGDIKKVLPSVPIKIVRIYEIELHWYQSLWWSIRWEVLINQILCFFIPKLKDYTNLIEIK